MPTIDHIICMMWNISIALQQYKWYYWKYNIELNCQNWIIGRSKINLKPYIDFVVTGYADLSFFFPFFYFFFPHQPELSFV